MNNNQIVPWAQFGFKQKYTTSMNLILLISEMMNSIKEYSKRHYIAFFDYTKAFDSIDHSLLT